MTEGDSAPSISLWIAVFLHSRLPRQIVFPVGQLKLNVWLPGNAIAIALISLLSGKENLSGLATVFVAGSPKGQPIKKKSYAILKSDL